MRQVIGGTGADTTASTVTYLTTNINLMIRNLYLFGESADSTAVFLTDHEAPLTWTPWGAFQPANISRGAVATKVGLDITSLEINWRPKTSAITTSIATASYYQLAQLGFFDNMKCRVWSVFMPTPGDANTLGACELFGGWIQGINVGRDNIQFTVESFLSVVNQQIPPNVVELNNTLAGFMGARPPVGFTTIPQFNVIVGSTPTALILDCTNIGPHHVFANGAFTLGYVVFNNPAGATLAGSWSAIANNSSITVSGTPYNLVQLFQALPWAPTPGTDTCYISAANPINQSDGDYEGFPYVPVPQVSVI